MSEGLGIGKPGDLINRYSWPQGLWVRIPPPPFQCGLYHGQTKERNRRQLMLVFIDESGDSGMKAKAGSSRLFVVTAIIFEDNEDASECDRRINDLRAELGLHERYEFHFNSCSNRFRSRFLETVCGSQFFYSSIVLNNGDSGEGDRDSGLIVISIPGWM